jgi:hypothetical protein
MSNIILTTQQALARSRAISTVTPSADYRAREVPRCGKAAAVSQ